MTETIKKLDELLKKYYDALKSGKKKKQATIYNEYLELKKEEKSWFNSLSKSDKKTYKMICSEFLLLSNEEERNKLFKDVNKSQTQSPKLTTNDEYLKESKNTASNTTRILKNSLQTIEEAKQIATDSVVIINIDEQKLHNIDNKMDEIQSDSKIASRLIVKTFKSIYTDKLIILVTFIVVCLIIFILLFKYKIIG